MATLDPPPFDGAPEWRATHTLADGTSVTVRPISPDDREELRRAFGAASARTRYLRFFTVTSELAESTLDYLTNVDQDRHVALVATVETPDLKTERGVGVARFIRIDGQHAAEAAVTVADDMQRRGIGTVLAHELARAAQVRGLRSLRAEVLADNKMMRAILEAAGAKQGESHGATLAYDLEIPPAKSSFVGILRGAAETMAMGIRRLSAPTTTDEREAEGRDRDREEPAPPDRDA